jgi:beta-glucanase (GH16 family)
MYAKTISASLLATILATSVSAQTHSDCRPDRQDCPSVPALGTTKVDVDYRQGEDKTNFFKLAAGTEVGHTDKGLTLTIAKRFQAPTLISNKYIHFGKVEVVMQAAPGAGIVSSIVLQADDLDEVDWEWVGSDNANVQTNYFAKGDDSTFDRGKVHPMSNPTSQMHTYTIDWTRDSLKWILDGTVIRELTPQNAQKGKNGYPQHPCQIRIGSWVGGDPDLPKGTQDWAGGLANFDNGPFIAYYQSIKVTDYMNFNSSAKEYKYAQGSARSGDWESVTVVGGSGDSGDSGSSSTTLTTATSSRTTTSPTSSPTSGSGNSTTPTGTTNNNNNNGGGSNTGATNPPPTSPAPGSGAGVTLPSTLLMGAALAIGYLAM